MSYTRAWNESTPLGSAARNTVDDIFRDGKVDIRERMNALVVDWTADPVVPQARVMGNLVGKVINIHWSAFIPMGEFNTNWTMDDAYMEDTSLGNTTLYAPVILPMGVTITNVSWRVFPNGGGNWQVKFFRVYKPTGTASDIVSTLTSAGTVAQTLTSGTISQAVDDAYTHALKIQSPGSPARFLWASITYDAPDSRYTL